MKNLLDAWPTISAPLHKKQILLFLDFDGTLAPIARTPDRAALSSKTRKLLLSISRRKDCKITIVTGRALKDIEGKVGIKNIGYVGNHGFEIGGTNILSQDRAYLKIREKIFLIIKDLFQQLEGLPGVFVEDKGVTLSVHYRLVKARQQRLFRWTFKQIVAPYLRAGDIVVHKGKKVFEVRPPMEWDKGKAVFWLLKDHFHSRKKHCTTVIYIGDDRTDEDAFKALRGHGITVRVGRRKISGAQYSLKDVAQVTQFLEMLLRFKRHKKIS